MGYIYSTMSQLQRKASVRKTALSFKLLTEKTGRCFAFPGRMHTANVQVPGQREQKQMKTAGVGSLHQWSWAAFFSFKITFLLILMQVPVRLGKELMPPGRDTPEPLVALVVFGLHCLYPEP